MKDFISLKTKIIDNNYCIGCGTCAYVAPDNITIKFDEHGKFQAVVINNNLPISSSNVTAVCPFYPNDENENTLAATRFSSVDGILHNTNTGYYYGNYVGHIIDNQNRLNSSSGGFGTWIATKMLEQKIVDKVIHVKSNVDHHPMYTYQISSDVKEVQEGSKSKYYPVELSEVLKYVRENDYRYLFVGLPCYIKSIMLLQKNDEVIKSRIKFTLGLVCGHLKSEYFAKAMAWEMGIKPQELSSFDFRIKSNNSTADHYKVKAKGRINNIDFEHEEFTRNLLSSNWGYGFFKYNACDYCDDVFAELSDVTIGDAWLPEYTSDSMGANIIIVRNPIINDIIMSNRSECSIENIDIEKIVKSQIGGIRHKKEELSYRLYLKDKSNKFRPVKRVTANCNISRNRKKIQEYRLELTRASFAYFSEAMINDDLNLFINRMKSKTAKYQQLYIQSILGKIYNKVMRLIRRR